ncbi:predicted protein [Postia placenta Mad-698-R]|nr:predicted protein [Postia placenta Mad-698-R]
MFEGAQRALGLSCRKPNVTIITQVAPPSVFAALFAQLAYNQRRNDGFCDEPRDHHQYHHHQPTRQMESSQLLFGFMQWEGGQLDITAQIAIAICGCLAIYTGWTAMHVKYMSCLCGAAISWIWMRSAIAAACILAAFVIAVVRQYGVRWIKQRNARRRERNEAPVEESSVESVYKRQTTRATAHLGLSHRKAGSRGDVSESFARRMPAEQGVYKIDSGQGFVDTQLAKCAIDRQVKT